MFAWMRAFILGSDEFWRYPAIWETEDTIFRAVNEAFMRASIFLNMCQDFFSMKQIYKEGPRGLRAGHEVHHGVGTHLRTVSLIWRTFLPSDLIELEGLSFHQLARIINQSEASWQSWQKPVGSPDLRHNAQMSTEVVLNFMTCLEVLRTFFAYWFHWE